MEETCLYHYDPKTSRQLIEWRQSVTPRPKYNEYKNQLEKFLTQFFGIKSSSTLISFQRDKYQLGVLLISAGKTEK